MVRASGSCGASAKYRIRCSVQRAFVAPGVDSLHQRQGGAVLGQIPAVAFEKDDVRRKYPIGRIGGFPRGRIRFSTRRMTSSSAAPAFS